jgi:hypothetical protein
MSAPPLNPTSFRYPFQLEGKAEPEVVQALRYHASGILDLNQAIAALKEQVKANKTAIQNTVTNTSTTSAPPTPNPFPFLGTVNDQRGNPLYLTQVSDNGAKIVLGDSSPITLQLNAMVTPPWFCVVDNDSSSTVTFAPTSGSVIGAQSMPDSSFTTIFFNGINFFAGIT